MDPDPDGLFELDPGIRYPESWIRIRKLAIIFAFLRYKGKGIVKVGPPVHNYEHEAGSYGDGFT
jgi:hypothetical protein